jgi:hypothetical protein
LAFVLVREDDMKTLTWNSIIQALILVRIGQELGTESELARAIHDVVAAVLAFWP